MTLSMHCLPLSASVCLTVVHICVTGEGLRALRFRAFQSAFQLLSKAGVMLQVSMSFIFTWYCPVPHTSR